MTMKLMALGDIADYTPAVKAAIAQKFALAAGVSIDSVHVDVASASVAISVTVFLPKNDSSTEMVSDVNATLTRLLHTPRDATQFLSSIANGSISVLLTYEPQMIDETSQALAHPVPPLASSSAQSVDSSRTSGTDFGVTVGAGLSGLAVSVIAIILIVKKCKGNRAAHLLQVERKMRSMSIATLDPKAAGMEMKLVSPRNEVLSDHI